MQAGAPFVAAMHPMEPDHVHEEIELHAARLLVATTSSGWPGPRSGATTTSAHDQTPHYAYMKTVLQILQWYRPTRALGAEVAPAPRAASARC